MVKAHEVKDISLAELGRKKIHMSEKEMPGLMSLREAFGARKPRKGARTLPKYWANIETLPSTATLMRGTRRASSTRTGSIPVRT